MTYRVPIHLSYCHMLLAEAYDILHVVGGLSNDEIAKVFTDWNQGPLQSFLIEITAIIAAKKDEMGTGYLLDKIVDKTGSKGTGAVVDINHPLSSHIFLAYFRVLILSWFSRSHTLAFQADMHSHIVLTWQ